MNETQARMAFIRDRSRFITARVRQLHADAAREHANGNKAVAQKALEEIGALSSELLTLGTETESTLRSLLKQVDDLKQTAEKKAGEEK